jgi:hypothetical protein
MQPTVISLDSPHPDRWAVLAEALRAAGFLVRFGGGGEPAPLSIQDAQVVTLRGAGVGELDLAPSVSAADLCAAARLVAELQQLQRELQLLLFQGRKPGDMALRIAIHDAMNELMPMLVASDRLRRLETGAEEELAGRLSAGVARLREMLERGP